MWIAERMGVTPWECAAIRKDTTDHRHKWYWRVLAYQKAKDRGERLAIERSKARAHGQRR